MPNFRKQNPMGLPQSDRVVYVQGPEGPAGLTGKEGPEGPDGAQGVPGPRGWSGLQGPPGEPGPQGTPGQDGADGVQGSPGADAYQIAVVHGFVGTEAQWLASLVGPQGEKGDTGERGETGLQGATGVGLPGLPGEDGQVLTLVDHEAMWAAPSGGGVAAWDSATTYVIGDLVVGESVMAFQDYTSYHGKCLYRSLQNGNTDHNPDPNEHNEAWWQVVGPLPPHGLGVGATQGYLQLAPPFGELEWAPVDLSTCVTQYSSSAYYGAFAHVYVHDGDVWRATSEVSPGEAPGTSAKWVPCGMKVPTAPATAGQVLTATGTARDSYGWDYQHPVRNRMRIIEEDFLTVSANTLNGLTGAAILSGTMGFIAGDAHHLGVAYLRDSTTSNGGYAVKTDTAPILIAGGEIAEFIFQSCGSRSTAGFRMGFEDSFAIQTQPTDAVCFEVADQSTKVIRGMCKNNAGPTYTGSTYTLTSNTWYRGKITVNAAATSVTFEIFSGNGESLWSSTVSGNIPTASGRQLGFGVVAGETTTGAAADIMYLDYMALDINRTLTR